MHRGRMSDEFSEPEPLVQFAGHNQAAVSKGLLRNNLCIRRAERGARSQRAASALMPTPVLFSVRRGRDESRPGRLKPAPRRAWTRAPHTDAQIIS